MKENLTKQQLINLLFLGALSISQAVKLGLKLEDNDGQFANFNWQKTDLRNIGSIKEYYKDSPAGYFEHLNYDIDLKRLYGSEKNYFKDKMERMQREALRMSRESDHKNSAFPISQKNIDVNFEKDSIFTNKYNADRKKK